MRREIAGGAAQENPLENSSGRVIIWPRGPHFNAGWATGMIDLHSHTTASDGELSPEDLLARARGSGVTTLAVTDHDTVKGLARARAAADTQGIRLVPGIEVSTEAEGREIPHPWPLRGTGGAGAGELLQRLGDERAERMGRMVERMNQLGFPVTLEEVKRIAAGAHLGRPHLALALVERGSVTSTREAFDRFLGDGSPAMWTGSG